MQTNREFHQLTKIVCLLSALSICGLTASSFKKQYEKCEEEYATCFSRPILSSRPNKETYPELIRCTILAMRCKEAAYKQKIKKLKILFKSNGKKRCTSADLVERLTAQLQSKVLKEKIPET